MYGDIFIYVYTRQIWARQDWDDEFLKKFHPFVIFSVIFKLIKYPVSVIYHNHIWQVSRRQLSNMNVIWRVSHMFFFYDDEYISGGEIGGQSIKYGILLYIFQCILEACNKDYYYYHYRYLYRVVAVAVADADSDADANANANAAAAAAVAVAVADADAVTVTVIILVLLSLLLLLLLSLSLSLLQLSPKGPN